MNKKIVIVGAGFVGATTAYAIMVQGIADEIVLLDIAKDKAEGEIMDLKHAREFAPFCKLSFSDDYSVCKDAKIVIITAGVRQRPGESRLQLINKNVGIAKSIVNGVLKHNKECIFLVVSNPVDILTYLTIKWTGFDPNKVIGSGTDLDTARFKCILSDSLQISAKDVEGFVLGEHGNSSFPIWSSVKIKGTNLKDYKDYDKINLNEIAEKVRNTAPEIVKRKGATYFGVSLLVSKIAKSIINDENKTFLVSNLLKNYEGINDICLSTPCVIGKDGINEKLPVSLNEEEKDNLEKSSDILKEWIKKLD